MYDVVLVDDESLELRLLLKVVDWNSFDMRVAYAADNSYDALEYVRKKNPHIVITDIKMPGMSGIELASQIRSFSNDIVILFISAFTDFEYAKSALRLDVSDYILKPVSKDNIEECCRRTKEKLDKKYSDPGMKSLLCQQIIYDFLSGTATDTAGTEKSLCENGVTVSLTESECAAVRIKINDFGEYLRTSWSYGADRLYSAILKLTENSSLFILPISYSFNTINAVAIKNENSKADFQEALEAVLKSTSENAADCLKASAKTEVLQKSQSLKAGGTEIAELFSIPQSKDKHEPDNDSTTIARAKEYINKNYKNDITLSEIAEYVYLTPYYFSKVFKAKTGEKYIDYLNRIRIEKSKELLSQSEMKVADIYKNVGYNSKNHFYKMFKLFCGITPQEYRTKYFKR